MIAERTKWHRVPDERVLHVKEEQPLRSHVAGKTLCFLRSNGKIHAMADHCPHQGKPISGGWCEEGHIVCPWHRFQFDPATGRSRNGMTVNLETFATEVRKDGVYVGFPYTTISIFGFDLW